jgi:hypothetical protein
MLVVVQFSSVDVGGLMFAGGGVLFCVMVIAAVAEQPFAPVTETVYVPGSVTLNVALFPTFVVPFDQA